MKFSLVFGLLALSSCLLASTPATRAGAPAVANDFFPVPSQGFSIEAKDHGPSLLEVVTQFERATGQHLVVSAETRTMLEKTPSGISSKLDVPASEVYSVVEHLLVQSHFVLNVLRTKEPRMLAIESLDGTARNTIRGNALWVEPEQLAAFADHPAVLISTRLELDSIDVRTLSNTMRTMITDASTQQIVPLGNSNTLMILGFGSNVVVLARTLTAMNEVERAAQKRAAETAPKRPTPQPAPAEGEKRVEKP